MVEVRVSNPIAPADIAIARDVSARAAAADGHPSFGDAIWRDLAHPTPASTLLIAESDGAAVGVLHLAPTKPNGDGSIGIALVVAPEHRGKGAAHALLDATLERATAMGGGRLELWVFGADDRADRLATATGFTLERELWQMRVPLPVAEEPRWPHGIQVRAFKPGHDEQEWLGVNNRAFAADPDQGGWTLETLEEREEEPWFDPSGFLVALDDRGMAGFCWTKLHDAVPPIELDPLGEIYVIGVAPDRQGSGLGRALTVAGLASIHERGPSIGMLFVTAANTAAVGLYRELGFEQTRIDRAYARAIA
jgi:mycothiol synthase